jgi:hypothetical protein
MLNELIQNNNFRLHPSLVEQILSEAGEKRRGSDTV